ncbi:LytR C-terminal domain-containing protein [Nocardioides sp.]|jgi:hypothetical protein|uniref:LytR C-terminal domain-containing protein n=1 Tax=Nocardioides sp. TaxID=35761 RepID=UPI0031FE6DEF|nr:hypothetical protein [Nocardioides sp.]
MYTQARTAITLGVLGILVVIGASWGWSAVTEPFPGKVQAPVCVQQTIPAGERVFPQDVTVSVLNAGTREGLAGRTMQLLTDEGYAEGDLGNAPSATDVKGTEIWTSDPGSPAVSLVASRLGRGTQVVRRDVSYAGVVVVVGDDFTTLSKGRKSVVADSDSVICSPPVV